MEESLLCKKHVVAFLDILGSSEEMKKDDVGMLEKIHYIYTQALELCKENEDNIFRDFVDLKIKVFSDNILIAYEIKYDSFIPIYLVSQFVAILQFVGLYENILFRGGITIGELYFSDIFVWGKGLLRAYELESDIAIYPRVIYDDIILSELQKNSHSKLNSFRCCLVTQDNDMIFFVDYLMNSKNTPDYTDSLIYNNYIDIQEQLKKIQMSKVSQKLKWHFNYISKYLSFDIYNEEETKKRLSELYSKEPINS